MTITSKLSLALIAMLSASTAMVASFPTAAQSLLDGYWNPLYDEDVNERIPGPDQGYYAGLPVTKAAASVAQTWDPERLTEEVEQCRPHPSIYGFRGVGMLRVWERRDPYTQQQTQIETWIAWQQQHRHIWMPAAHVEHPPYWDLHGWEGFSTGRWVGNVLHVHTDMLMPAWTRRNGLPTDDRASMDEVYFRYGDVLTQIMMISDKQYLAQPLVKSNEFIHVPQAGMGPYPCRPADEIPRDAGIVPMHLPNQYSTTLEWAVRHEVPVAASYGGVPTEMPEYQQYMQGLKANPPMAMIEKEEQQEINRAEGLGK